jgi:hypothetical protein
MQTGCECNIFSCLVSVWVEKSVALNQAYAHHALKTVHEEVQI